MKPNLLIIQTDQQSLWTIGAYGGSLIDTPHIDRLAKEGVMFDNFFTVSAVCTPSRGCFLTGRYPHHHGAYRNDIPINRDEITLAHILKHYGYKTGYAGKWHLHGDEQPGWLTKDQAMGFEDSQFMFNMGHFKSVFEKGAHPPVVSREIGDEKTYTTDWLADKTIQYISQNKQSPFFFMVSIPDPHSPFNVRPPYDTLYQPNDMTVPSSFWQEKLPDWAEQDEWGRKICFPLGQKDREERLRRIKAQYCGEVKCIDDNVGKIISALQSEKLLDNTIVIFTTDHGEYMGEHGLLYKNNLYDSVYHIPLLMRWPEKIRPGTVVNKYVNIVDFQQTLLSLLEILPCGREQGRNARPLIFKEDIPWENEIFIHPSDVPRAGIITPAWELAYVGKGWGKDAPVFQDHILFDRRKDPEQVQNLFSQPDYQEVINTLAKKILEHHRLLGTDFSILPAALTSRME